MRVRYDLHVHSCLSPCGDPEMTPNNLVNMAALLGFDMIALTDHNTCLNCGAAMEVGESAGILVIPGMELTTQEEAHVVCLLPDLERALEFGALVDSRRPAFPNDPEIFGRQVIMDAQDRETGEIPNLLISAADISVDEVLSLAQRFGGTAFPAHVDKSSYSVIASLGAIPQEAGFFAAEISSKGDIKKLLITNPELEALILLKDSDSHYLENMPEPSAWLEMPEKSPACLINILNGKLKTQWSRE